MKKQNIKAIVGAVTLLAGMIGVAQADTLHAFCWGTTPACPDSSKLGVSPTMGNPPNFGFWDASGPVTGDYLIDILVPNNLDTTPSTLSYTVTGTQGGKTDSSAISGTATLVSTTAWTSGKLDTYLKLDTAPNTVSPENPIGAWLSLTQMLGKDPSASGYFVYQVDLGQNELQPQSSDGSGPLLSIGSSLDIGSLVLGFLGVSSTCTVKGPHHTTTTVDCTDWTATANSAALFEEGPGTPPNVPEPGTLALFGASLAGLGLFARRKSRAM